MNKKEIALIVHACDRYEFLYKGFSVFFNKFWDFNINCNYYFATENKNVDIKGFKNILSGKDEWSNRLKYLLENEIKENYVLYFQEDMWLNKKVNSIFFNELFNLTIKNQWNQVKLHSSEVYKTIETDLFIEGFNVSKIDNKKSDYLMSHQITLWNKNYLINQLKKNEHPWRNERNGTKRLKNANPIIYHIDYFAENGKPEINNNNKPKLRSEYQAISFNGTLSNNVLPYIEILNNGNELEKEYANKLTYNFNNNLTHDGKANPKKIDIFKKIKNFIKRL